MLPLSWIYSMVLMKRYIFVHKRLANITMNQKCIEHITLYSLVLVGTLVVGVLVRQYVLSKGVDDFSSSVAFFATVIVLMAIYASLQTTFNQFQTKLRLISLSQILPLKKQSLNPQNMKLCEPTL